MEQIIFNILKSSSRYWIRYFRVDKLEGMTLPGEYIEIRVHYVNGRDLKELFDAGFEIDRVQSKKIDADCSCDILLKRELNHKSDNQ